MNTNDLQASPIFRDQPMTHFEAVTPRHASLYAASQEPSDSLEALLRLCLVLCMLTALLICGWRISATPSAPVAAAQTAVAATTFCVNGQHVF